MQESQKNENQKNDTQLNGDSNVLTRKQRRMQERITAEAQEKFAKFCNKFSEWLYDAEELTEEIVINKIIDFNARWRIYCRQVNMNKDGYSSFKEFADRLYLAYKEELGQKEGSDQKTG